MLFAFILLLQLVPYNVQGKHFLVKTDDESNEGCFTMNTSLPRDCGPHVSTIQVLIGDKWTTVEELPADQRKKFEECFDEHKNKDVAPPFDPATYDPCEADPCCSCDEDGAMICSWNVQNIGARRINWEEK